MDQVLKKKVIRAIKSHPEIKVAYFFGSRATGGYNESSDYDFAIYLDSRDQVKNYNIRNQLYGELSKLLKTDAVDIVVIDSAEKPLLKYEIIFNGEVLHELEPHKVILEPRIMNEYFDYQLEMKKNNLTKDF